MKRHISLMLCFMLIAQSCKTYTQIPTETLPPPELEVGDNIRVTTTNDYIFRFTITAITNDGFNGENYSMTIGRNADLINSPIHIPYDEITSIRKLAPMKDEDYVSGLLIVGVTVVVGIVIYAFVDLFTGGFWGD